MKRRRSKKRPPPLKPAVPGIHGTAVYRLSTLYRLLGIGKVTGRRLRAAGLRPFRLGKAWLVDGRQAVEVLRRLAAEQQEGADDAR